MKNKRFSFYGELNEVLVQFDADVVNGDYNYKDFHLVKWVQFGSWQKTITFYDNNFKPIVSYVYQDGDVLSDYEEDERFTIKHISNYIEEHRGELIPLKKFALKIKKMEKEFRNEED